MTTSLGPDAKSGAPTTGSTPTVPGRASLLRRWDLVAVAVPVLIFAVMGWSKRWVTDDGLIFTRPVRQIVAGNGPVYNIGERAETSTSTAWQWLLALVHWVTPFEPARMAVYLGLFLSVVGVFIALSATRLAYRGLGVQRLLVPAGALIFIAVPSVWDFATAGMETGFIIFWIAASWWLLVKASQRGVPSLKRTLGTAVWFGLGPLVRPDLGLAMVVLLVAYALLAGHGWRRNVVGLVAAGALPVAYEIFRMGYYGLIFPMPALTKEAGESLWGRGWDYLTDYAKPYFLYVPFLLLAVAAYALLRNRRIAKPTVVLMATPIVAAAGQTVYVLKVGGDFMHGRMWLPVLLFLLLPMLLIPLDRLALPAVAGIAAWSVFVGGFIRTDVITTYSPIPGKNQVWNERDTYIEWIGKNNPTTQRDHTGTLPTVEAEMKAAQEAHRRELIADPNYIIPAPLPPLPLKSGLAYDYTEGLIIGRLGVGGAVVPLDGLVVDVWGLSNTVGAHITQTTPGAAGHEKLLPPAWNIALYVDPAGDRLVPPVVAAPGDIRAARAALQCGDLKELVDSVSAPLTAGRFWKNVTGSVSRTQLRIPANPVEAEQKFCGPGH